MRMDHIAVIGGGAAGLLAAVRLSQAGKHITLFERGERLGRKLSATGNGQGNVTNTDLASSHYRSSDMRLVSSVLRRFGREELLRYLRSLGGMFVSDGEGRVYPASRQAASVTDLLRYRLAALGIRLNTGEKVLSAHKSGGCVIVTTDRAEYSCSVLVLACGGKASPHFGTDGNGYELARSFGHTVTPLFPSLVQLKTETTHIRGLKGVRCDCRVQLLNGREVIGESRGDVIFTDYGVSGNAVFDLARFHDEYSEDSVECSITSDGAADGIRVYTVKLRPGSDVNFNFYTVGDGYTVTLTARVNGKTSYQDELGNTVEYYPFVSGLGSGAGGVFTVMTDQTDTEEGA